MPIAVPQNLGSNFYPKLVQISRDLGMKPEDILAIMVSESGINQGAYEAKYHGAGLVGFMPQTLKNLGFQGDWHDFVGLKGEEQLDYVKKLIQQNEKFNGGPFTSAAQYYIANFWPVALKLPGIKAGDSATPFVELNPATVSSKGKSYSKKYFDIGYKIDPKMEISAYKENPLFHGSTQGAITLGDMQRQVEKNKNTSSYKKAISDMFKLTGYQAGQAKDSPMSPISDNHNSITSGFWEKLKRIINMFVSATEEKHDFLISVGSSADRAATVEYARILSTALEEYLGARTTICADANNVEIECKVAGDLKLLHPAIKQLSASISDVFKQATQAIKPITTFSLIICNSKSDFKPLNPKVADLYYVKFKNKFASSK